MREAIGIAILFFWLILILSEPLFKWFWSHTQYISYAMFIGAGALILCGIVKDIFCRKSN